MMHDRGPAGWSERTARMALREKVVPLAFALASGSAAWGLGHSDVLTNRLWTPVMAYQAGILALAVVAVVILAVVIERCWQIRLEASLACAGAIALFAGFGAAP